MRLTLVRLTLAPLLAVLLSLGLLAPSTAVASTQMTATEAVNVRATPSTSGKIVGGLYRGQTVTAISTANGWTKVSYAGKTAYVFAKYLAKGADLPSTGGVGTGTTKITTTDVNLRKGPGTTYAIITVIKDGAKVTLTGKTAKGYTEVKASSKTGWVSSQYLTSATSGLPAVIGTRVTTAELSIRKTSDDDSMIIASVKKGTTLSITGATASERAQIIYNGAVAWVTAKYLSNGDNTSPTVPALPKITGTRYATANLTIRSTSGSTYTTIGEIAKGSIISITGVVENARMQIIYNGAVRWVTAKYLSTSKPTTSTPGSAAVEKGLKPNAIKTYRAVIAQFPQITTVYAVRKDALPDHPSGRALDFMIPNYKSTAGKALGKEVSRWIQANQAELGINYIIWDQHIWNVQRNKEGWRYMATRGGDSADHKNHVHVTVLADGYKPI